MCFQDVSQPWLLLWLRPKPQSLKLALDGVWDGLPVGGEELGCLLLVLWSSEWSGPIQPWWCVQESFLVGLSWPTLDEGFWLIGMPLSLALAICGDHPPCAALTAFVATLDLVLPYPIVTCALGAYLICTTPVGCHSSG